MEKYEFGVMSSKYELMAPNLRVAKLAMTLFISQNVPIVIYSPIEDGFWPMKFMEEEMSKKPPKELKEVFDSIKKIL